MRSPTPLTFLSCVALGLAESYAVVLEASEARCRTGEQLANVSLPAEPTDGVNKQLATVADSLTFGVAV